MLRILRAFVEAYAQPNRGTGGREPILLLRHMGGHTLHHHALPNAPDVDEGLLRELMNHGWIDLDYIEHGLQITPTVTGRTVIEDQDRVQHADPVSDMASLVEAVAAQAASDNKLGWPAVRPVLAAVKDYWEGGGFSRHGVQLGAVLRSLPDEHQALFAVTVRSGVGVSPFDH
jgi:hypothetical protein